MSDFGIFEAAVTSDTEQKIAARKSADLLNAAIYDVQQQFGPFLFQATGLDDFNNRVALVKDDMIKTVNKHLPPVTGVMRRVVNAQKKEFKRLGADSALSADSVWGGPTGDAPGMSAGGADSTAQQATGTGAYAPGIPSDVQGPGMTPTGEVVQHHNNPQPVFSGPRRRADVISAPGQDEGSLGNPMAGEAAGYGETGNITENAGPLMAQGYRRTADSPSSWDDKKLINFYNEKCAQKDLDDSDQSTLAKVSAELDRRGLPKAKNFTADKDILEPKGDFDAYLDSVDKNAPQKIDHNFTGDAEDNFTGSPESNFTARRYLAEEMNWPDTKGNDKAKDFGGREYEDSHEQHEDVDWPNQHRATKMALELYADWCDANRLRAGSIRSLQAYGPYCSDPDYRRIVGAIQRRADFGMDAVDGLSTLGESAGQPTDIGSPSAGGYAAQPAGPGGGALGDSAGMGNINGYPMASKSDRHYLAEIMKLDDGHEPFDPMNSWQKPSGYPSQNANDVTSLSGGFPKDPSQKDVSTQGVDYSKSLKKPKSPPNFAKGGEDAVDIPQWGDSASRGNKMQGLDGGGATTAFGSGDRGNKMQKLQRRRAAMPPDYDHVNADAYWNEDGPDSAFSYDPSGHQPSGKGKPNPKRAPGDEGPGGYFGNRRRSDFNNGAPVATGQGYVPPGQSFSPSGDGSGNWVGPGELHHDVPTISESLQRQQSPEPMKHHKDSYYHLADKDHLQNAGQSITDLLNQLAQDFQDSIGPLQQALQAIEYAKQVQQQSSPLNVMPGGGINVLPQEFNGQPALGAPGFDKGQGQAPGAGMGAVPGSTQPAQGQPPAPPPAQPIPAQQTARRRQSCYPGCHENEEHAKKFHKDKESRRRWADEQGSLFEIHDIDGTQHAFGNGSGPVSSGVDPEGGLMQISRQRWAGEHEYDSDEESELARAQGQGWAPKGDGPGRHEDPGAGRRSPQQEHAYDDTHNRGGDFYAYRHADAPGSAVYPGGNAPPGDGSWNPADSYIQNQIESGGGSNWAASPNAPIESKRRYVAWCREQGLQPTPNGYQRFVARSRTPGKGDRHLRGGDFTRHADSIDDAVQRALQRQQTGTPVDPNNSVDPSKMWNNFNELSGFDQPRAKASSRHGFTPQWPSNVPYEEGYPGGAWGPGHPHPKDSPYEDRQYTDEELGLGYQSSRHSSSRRQAWSGWGPSQFQRHHQASGWEWNHRLNGYIATSRRDFTCDCGESMPVPSYTSCRCGKLWNSYAIGNVGDLKTGGAEKFICREIPVRPDVIVANRRMAASATHNNGKLTVNANGATETFNAKKAPAYLVVRTGNPNTSSGISFTQHGSYDSAAKARNARPGEIVEVKVANRQAGFNDSFDTIQKEYPDAIDHFHTPAPPQSHEEREQSLWGPTGQPPKAKDPNDWFAPHEQWTKQHTVPPHKPDPTHMYNGTPVEIDARRQAWHPHLPPAEDFGANSKHPALHPTYTDWGPDPKSTAAEELPDRYSFRKGAPFADYDDFADCESKNQDKGDTGAYCGEIKHRTEDKQGRRRRAMPIDDFDDFPGPASPTGGSNEGEGEFSWPMQGMDAQQFPINYHHGAIHDITQPGECLDEDGEDPGHPQLKKTPDDWHRRDVNQRWTA